MCGIAGIMTATGAAPDAAKLDGLGDALAHRGPDGRGRYVSGGVGMVQTRLAVIDLKTGDQPFFEPGGGALIANAEIYNYVELRREAEGFAFVSDSDCEPPLHLYRRDGLDFTKSLRGMYAIAIHDATAGQLVLARDPFGIKPIYYVEADGSFAFASEPQALIAAGLITPEVRPEARAELLQLQFTCGRETIFRGIHRVLPGETLVVAGARVVERRQTPALPEGGHEALGEAEALVRLEAALRDSVTVHQRSDVPYGMFLSGGIDSSTVLALMAGLNERPVRAYTIGFSGTSVADERALARRVAVASGAEHVEVEFSEDDFWQTLPKIAAAIDDPAADYAILPTYKLAGVAGRDLKVILSGEGGDEMFGGYGRYRSVLRPWWRGGRIPRARGIFDGLGVLRADTTGWRDAVAASEITEASSGRSRLQVAQATDCAGWLANDLLIKLDRCLMAHGVEGRTPFLDPAVAELAFVLPDHLKVQGGLGKWLLRKWLADHRPEAEPFSRKRGFTVPVGEWMAGRAKALGGLVAAQPGIGEIADPIAVEKLYGIGGKRPQIAAWTLLFYALWHRRHILGRAGPGEVGGDVMETLADSQERPPSRRRRGSGIKAAPKTDDRSRWT